MTWEALTAVGTMLSALVIAVTVLLTARQLRITTQQLDHLRRATQLEGAMSIFADLSSPAFSEAQRFVTTELEQLMHDADFKKGVPLAGRADLTVHKEILFMRTWERIGAYVKHGLLDGEIIYDVALPVIKAGWDRLQDVIAIHREVIGPAMWENFEFIYKQSMHFAKQHDVEIRSGLTVAPSDDASVN